MPKSLWRNGQRPCRRRAFYEQSGAVPLLALPAFAFHRLALLLQLTPAARSAFVKETEDHYELVLYPKWKFTDSCGRPRVAGGIHVGCTHDGHMQYGRATRRALLKAGVAI